MHNSMAFLPDYLQSIANQTFTDWEIILVDDASADESTAYIRSQRIVSPESIKTISLDKNHGPFYARRIAFKHAKNDYILCVDADDELLGVDALSCLAAIIDESKPDIVAFNMTRDKSTASNLFIDYGNLGPAKFDGPIEYRLALKKFIASYSLNNLASKAIRRDLLNGRQPDTVHLDLNEDRYEVFQVLKQAQSFFLINKPLYYYRPNNTSTTEKGYEPSHLKQISYVESQINNFAEANGLDATEEMGIYLGSIGAIIMGLSRPLKLKGFFTVAQDLRAMSFFRKACASYFDRNKKRKSMLLEAIYDGNRLKAYFIYRLRLFLEKA